MCDFREHRSSYRPSTSSSHVSLSIGVPYCAHRDFPTWGIPHAGFTFSNAGIGISPRGASPIQGLHLLRSSGFPRNVMAQSIVPLRHQITCRSLRDFPTALFGISPRGTSPIFLSFGGGRRSLPVLGAAIYIAVQPLFQLAIAALIIEILVGLMWGDYIFVLWDFPTWGNPHTGFTPGNGRAMWGLSCLVQQNAAPQELEGR